MTTHIPAITEGKEPASTDKAWRYLGSLGRSSAKDPRVWGSEVGTLARDLGASEVRLCKGPFGVLRAYAKVA